jgi:hypothetical protein
MMYTLEGDKVKMKFWGIDITREIVCTNGGVCHIWFETNSWVQT